jgi:hypothetical protein
MTAGGKSWRQRLLLSIAEGCGCKIVLKGSYGKSDYEVMDIIGHRDNVATVGDLFNELSTLFVSMAGLALDTYKHSFGGKQPSLFYELDLSQLEGQRISDSEFTASFLHGAVAAVRDRFQEQLWASRKKASTTTLMVIDDKVDETMKKLYPKLGKTKSSLRPDHRRGYAAGYAAGQRVSLTPSRKVGSSEPKHRIA